MYEKLGERRGDHNSRNDGAAEGRSRPAHGRGFLAVIDRRGVVSRVEPVHGYVDDPYTVDVDKQMAEGALLEIRLEDAVPVDPVKPRELLG